MWCGRRGRCRTIVRGSWCGAVRRSTAGCGIGRSIGRRRGRSTHLFLALLLVGAALVAGSTRVDAEAKDLGHVGRSLALLDDVGVLEHEEVRECGAKEGAIDGRVTRVLGEVDFLARRTVHLQRVLHWHVAEPDGEERLAEAVDAWARTKVALAHLLEHHLQSERSHDEAGVDQSVQCLGIALHNLLLALVKLVVALVVQNHVQRVIVVGHCVRETIEVEVVLDKLLRHLHVKLVSPVCVM